MQSHIYFLFHNLFEYFQFGNVFRHKQRVSIFIVLYFSFPLCMLLHMVPSWVCREGGKKNIPEMFGNGPTKRTYVLWEV